MTADRKRPSGPPPSAGVLAKYAQAYAREVGVAEVSGDDVLRREILDQRFASDIRAPHCSESASTLSRRSEQVSASVLLKMASRIFPTAVRCYWDAAGRSKCVHYACERA